MKNSRHLTIVFIAFVLGQAIQLFVAAIAYNLYANRPVMWNVVGALISVAIVVISFVVIRMETEDGEGFRVKGYLDYARPPLETDPEPIENDKL